MEQAFIPSIREAGAGGIHLNFRQAWSPEGVPGHLELHNETLSQQKKNERKKWEEKKIEFMWT